MYTVEESYKQIMIRKETYQRLKHNKQYFPVKEKEAAENSIDSYDDLIVRLLNFYESFDKNRRY